MAYVNYVMYYVGILPKTCCSGSPQIYLIYVSGIMKKGYSGTSTACNTLAIHEIYYRTYCSCEQNILFTSLKYSIFSHQTFRI